MNSDENENEMLEWDKKNISRFAQYLYDLAKTKAEEEAFQAEKLKEQEVTVEESVVEEEVTPIAEESVIEEEVTPIAEESVIEEEEIVHEQVKRSRELEEVTIGLAKAVSGEDVEEIVSDKNLEEIKEIIEQEKIPLPSEEKETAPDELLTKTTESTADPSVTEPELKIKIEKLKTEREIQETEVLATKEFIEQLEIIEEHRTEIETIDSSTPIVTEPIIDEDVLIKPENIPEDIHKFVFVGEASSVPITEEEIPHVEVDEETLKAQDISLVKEITKIEKEIATKKILEPEVVSEPEVDAELQAKMKRREEIIQQMLKDAKKKEEEDLTIRGLGETEGRKYSAVVFGQESNRNLKKWKRIAKQQQREDKKEKKKKKK
ncbi:MAG: hypothetical protein H7647_01370 [Candidatus Heimdallarchaeota archaeon]|nr:hypothetical protein [Candidatus Heimdallarchaeota archaeon]MCK4253081.1 hypothetical protein [Candidatus Heimdallarchaeota archaeon]